MEIDIIFHLLLRSQARKDQNKYYQYLITNISKGQINTQLLEDGFQRSIINNNQISKSDYNEIVRYAINQELITKYVGMIKNNDYKNIKSLT